MLKSIQNLIKNTENISKLNSSIQYGIKRESKGKQLKKKIKYREARPWLFQRKTRISPPDLTQENMTFPINIPIKVSYIYRPIKNKLRLPTHDFINFKQMSGNQILLHLENPENLREGELCSALIEISRKEISPDFDWNQHEWIQGTVEHIKKHINGFQSSSISYLTLAFHKLNITDEELWSSLQHVVDKTMHNFNAKGFGYTYTAFLENQRGTQEFREKLSLRLPIHLHKMSPLLITKCFEVTVKNKLMNDHLFDNHFHILFWRRLQWFQDFYPSIINNLVEMGHRDDPEFWQECLLPSIRKIQFTKEENIVELISALNNLNVAFSNEVKVADIISYLEDQLVFVQTKLKAIENAKFYNVVMNDIKYFEEKQKLKLQQQQQE